MNLDVEAQLLIPLPFGEWDEYPIKAKILLKNIRPFLMQAFLIFNWLPCLTSLAFWFIQSNL